VNITGVDPSDETVDGAVLELVSSLGGSISAEHGIGVAKRRWLELNRSSSEIAAMRAVKRALDPAGILSPNVLVRLP
jgi:FAD/FMN-containing dehydrogenase